MANSRFYQFLFSKNAMLTMLEGNFAIGSSGAVSGLKGSGITAVTRLSAGTYRITFEEPYYRFLCADFRIIAPVTGSNVTDGSFVSGTTYQITALGTTNWNAIGVPSGVTAAVGMTFVATGIGGSGAGTAKAVGVAANTAVQLVGDPNLGVITAANGVIIQCVGTGGSVGDPSSGSSLEMMFWMRNSSVKGKGE